MEAKGSNAVDQNGIFGAGSNDWLVSVVIPVYKAERSLHRCVDSVLSQTYQRFEIVLVDDGSPDTSGLICDEYKKTDERVTVIHQENQGVSAARNTGIELAKGKYILFLDSDDFIELDMLDHYIAVAQKHNADAVVGALNFYDETDLLFKTKQPAIEGCYGRDIWEQLCIDSEIYGYAGGKMLSRKLLNQYAIRFNHSLTSQEDLALCLEVYYHSDRIVTTAYAGYNYNFTISARKPQYGVYLRNQMNILAKAREKHFISHYADCMLRKRVCSLVYMFLYSEYKNDESYAAAISTLRQIPGLMSYLKEKLVFGEQGWIGMLAGLGVFGAARGYFAVREIVKSALKGHRL